MPTLRRDIHDVRQTFDELLEVARGYHKDILVIFDGLDRLIAPEKFWAVAHQDLRLFRHLGVSILATAPISVLYGGGVGQSVSDNFDRVHHLSVLTTDPKQGFLTSVLRKRGAYELLGEDEAESVCRYSGGVLRDLIALARDAAEEAYIAGHNYVMEGDVDKVVEQLGTSYLRGLGPDAVKTLLELQKNGSFKIDRSSNVELLVTRRVLEYSSIDSGSDPALLHVLSESESTNV